MLSQKSKMYTTNFSTRQYKNCINLLIVTMVIALSENTFSLVQAQNDTESALRSLEDFSHTFDYEYTNASLKNIKRLIYSKCEKLGVPDSVIGEITDGAIELRTCMNKLINSTELYNEIETARPVGTLDTVFKKYCDRRSILTECVSAFNVKLLPCLSLEEQAQDYIVMRIIYTLLEFFCQRNGDPIILFIAEQGPECLESQKQYIINCLNATFQDYLPERDQEYHLNELPEFIIQPAQCVEIHELERCVLHHMEQCSEATPANMVEAIFRYIRKETKCQREIDKVLQQQSLLTVSENVSRSNGMSLQVSFLTLLFCGTLFYLR